MRDIFAEQLLKRLFDAQFHEYRDNHDEMRFGPLPRMRPEEWAKWKMRNMARACNFYRRHWLRRPDWYILSQWLPLIPELEWLYGRLADDKSRKLLVDVIAFRIMGNMAVRLPLGNEAYRRQRDQIGSLADGEDTIAVAFMNSKLKRYDLSSIGFPVKFYGYNPSYLFDVEEYAYSDPLIAASPGDVVIDGGGCYGDATLYFAHKTAPGGHVHVFEFVSSNLQILQRNLDLNPDLKKRITVAENALWNSSNIPVYVRENGPASSVQMDPTEGFDLRSSTIMIDDYVASKGLARVDFIKMDIEGAEENALLGAERTIREFRPKMAVCLYHSPKDFVRLPRLLDKYCPDYRFYIKHAAMYAEETVLFATVG